MSANFLISMKAKILLLALIAFTACQAQKDTLSVNSIKMFKITDSVNWLTISGGSGTISTVVQLKWVKKVDTFHVEYVIVANPRGFLRKVKTDYVIRKYESLEPATPTLYVSREIRNLQYYLHGRKADVIMLKGTYGLQLAQ